jgi:DNA-binding GntR family transcriptional regulator
MKFIDRFESYAIVESQIGGEAMKTNRTKAERVYELLRGDILAGRLPPGARLRYAELCERYAASTGVLREAMLRLCEQGLVKGEPQQGFQVVGLSVEDLRDLTEARVVLETLVFRSALANGDIEWESGILAAHHRLARTPQHDIDDPDRLSDDWVTKHAAFHHALLDGCANQRLKEIARSLRDSAELYRQWSLPLGNGAERDISSEHDELLEAVLVRDADRAVESLPTHITRTSNMLLDTYAAASTPTSRDARYLSTSTG